MFFNNNRLKDTIFLKETSDLKGKYEALERLIKEYPDNEELKEELFIVKKGLEGENEIKYQLSKSNIGMYVLRDINIEYNGLKSQIDYIVITKAYIYFIECKNLIGNIIVNENGDFIREFNFYGKKIRKGMYSPIRQVDAQLDVYRKIWQNNTPDFWSRVIKKYNGDNLWNGTFKGYVVACNQETILNTKYAPSNIKARIMRSDNLIRKIEQDVEECNHDLYLTEDQMKDGAERFLEINVDNIIDYYEEYKKKLVLNINEQNSILNQKLNDEVINRKEIKEPTFDTCPLCKGKLVQRTGKYGKFMGCENYPDCKYTRNI